MVGVQPAPVEAACAFLPDDGFSHTGAVHIAPPLRVACAKAVGLEAAWARVRSDRVHKLITQAGVEALAMH